MKWFRKSNVNGSTVGCTVETAAPIAREALGRTERPRSDNGMRVRSCGRTGRSWGGMALAALFALCAFAVPERAGANTSYWDTKIKFKRNGTTDSDWTGATTGTALGSYGSSGSLSIVAAGINAWSDNNMYWDNTYLFYKLDTGSYSSVQLPHQGNSGNDHYFGWDTTLNINLLSGLSAGSHTLTYKYQFKDNSGTHDTGEYTATFTVLGKPTIGSPTATSITTGGATLGATVTADGGATVTSYGVRVGTSANPTSGGYSNSGAPTTGTAFSKAVTGLSAGTLYHYRGFAVNSEGTSYTSDSTFTTKPNAPTITSVSAPSSTSVKFTVNANGNGSATTYKYIVGTSAGTPATACTAGSAVTVSSLSPGTTYTIVAMATAGGNNSSTVSTTVTTLPTEPSVSVVARSTDYITILAASDVNGAATTHTYGYGTSSPATPSASITPGTNKKTSSLTPGTLYYFTVRASAGGGTADTTISATTKPVAPTITDVSYDATSVTFKVNPNGNGDNTAYHYTVNTTSGNTASTDCTTAVNNDSTITKTGLTTGTAYYIHVRARAKTSTSDTGWALYGPFTPTAAAREPSITSPTVASVTTGGATLGATVTSDGNDTITEYGVVWSTSADPTTASHSGGGISSVSGAPTVGSAWTRTVTGLTEGQTYHYRAYAKNGEGTSYTDDATFTVATVLELSATSWTYAGSNPTATISGGGGSGAYSVTLDSSSPASAGTVSVSSSTLTLSPSKAGTFNITLTKAANGIYAAQSKAFTLTLSKGSQATAVDLKTKTFTYEGSGFTLEGKGGNYGSYSFEYKADGTGSGSVSGSTLTPSVAGKMTVTVTRGGNDLWNPRSDDVEVTVNKGAQTVTISPTSATLYVGGSTVTVTGTRTVPASGGGAVSYASSATSKATVNSSGVVSPVAAGTANITATAAATDLWNAGTATCAVKVLAQKPGAATDLVITATTNTLTVSWETGSGGANTLVQINTANSFAAPADGSTSSTYTANNTTYTSGTRIGSKGYVVYQSNGKSVTVTNLAAGTHYYFSVYSRNGSSGYYSYGPAAAIDGWTLSQPVTTASATADGKTLVRLSWSKPTGSSGTMVVWKGTSEPVNGTSYSAGATTLGGKILYRGTDASKTLEHVVASGAEYSYKFYSYSSANGYSEALERTATMGSFGGDEIVDTFSYTNSINLGGLNGEHGWSAAWSYSGTQPTIVPQTGSGIPQFPNYSEYPANTGNRIKIAMNSDAANFSATRQFPQVTSGTIYAAAIMSYHYTGNKKWCRIVLQDGDTAKMAAGRIWESGDDKTIGIDDCNGGRTHGTYELNGWESSVNNDYLVIMKYDFSTKTISARAYYHGDSVPADEPSTWHVTKTLSANPSKLNKVSLQAGADSGGYTGDVYFDEVRVATSWSKLLARAATKPAVPTGFAAAADGNELVRLSWTLNSAGNGVMVLARADGSNPTAPTDGTLYNEGGTVDANTRVIYKGTGTSLEHAVAAGSTTKYAIHSYNGDNWYSTVGSSQRKSVTTGTYPASCAVAEAFAYTNGTFLTTSAGSQAWMTGGKGWAGAWNLTSVPGSWSPGEATKNASGVEGLLETTQLAGAGGNMFALYPGTTLQSVNKKAVLKRELATALSSGGTWWGMFTMKISASAANSWAGIQLLDASGASKASIGKLWGGTTAGIEGSATGSSSYGVTADHAYVYIFKWDGSKMWLHVQHVESTSDPNFSSYSTPTFSDADDTSVSLSMADIKYVQLVAENGNSGESGTCVGDTFFDEIRFGPSFAAMVGGSSTRPAAPGTLTATRDGNEMYRLSWEKNGTGSDVILVGTTDGSAPPTALVDNTSYAVGSTVAGTTAKVLYKGGATALDHVVAPGTTCKYRLFSDNGDGLYSSTGSYAAPEATGTYESWECLDTFSYTNGVQVSASGNAWKGGQGWGDNYWGSSGSGNWYSRKPDEVPGYMVNHVVNYPDSVGNVICITNLADGQNGTFNRVVESFGGSQGTTVYFAYRMAYAHSGAGQNRWAGIEFVSDVGGEKSVFVGKAAATDHQYHLGITATGASSPCWPNVGSGGAAYELKGLSDYAKSAYVVVGKIQWTAANTATIYANAFYTGDGDAELPENEPGWGAYGYSGATLGAINSIRFKAGADAGHGTIGYAYFDELRWGTSWEQLLAGKAPTDVWMDGQTTHVYTGDIVTNAITSTPKGAKQSAQSLLWTAANPNDTTWETYGIAAGFYTNKESETQTEWHGVHQITQTAATTLYGLGAVTGNRVTVKSQNHGEAAYKTHTYTVRALTAPSLSVTPGDFKETLSWTRATGYNEAGTSGGRTFNEVMVVRYSSSTASGLEGLKPVDGTAYYPGDVIYYNNDPARYMTVVYRGSDATSHVDAGLAKNTTYYYAAFTVNNTYYSPKSTVQHGETTGSSTTPVVDGTTTDWVGGASPTKNSSAYSEEEFIWTDKALEGRKDKDVCAFADIGEFRVKATASTVYFLLRLTNSTAASVRPTNTYVVVGVDTRTNSASTAMNWLGDESATFVGGGYWQTNAAIHYPERQMAVHYVGGGENTWQVEMYAENGADWYAPQNGDWAAACSADNSADPCIEWSVPRADLGLTGACTGRFTVATFVNSGVWNNQGVGTVRIGDDSCAAVDAMEFVPYGVNDQDGKLGSWDEGLKNGNVNFWADVRFATAGLDTHSAPTVPSPLNGASGQASPLLRWNASSDTDGFVTGYLLEVATNAAFGAGGDKLLYRVNVEGGTTTSYQTRTSVSNFYWRVRARDSAGILSSGTPQSYTVTGKTDRDGPLAKLLYVGTNVMAFINNTDHYRDDQEKSGDATSVEDKDLQDGGHVFGFVIEWYDVNGVYATNVNRNTGDFAWNILAEHGDGVTPYGRVSPNWDLLIIDRKTPAGTAPSPETVDGVSKSYTWKTGLELPTENGGTETIDCWYIDCGKDAVFTNNSTVTQIINDGNFGQYMTNYVINAFTFGGYRDGVELYLTVSAEDGCMDTGDAATSGDAGWYPWPSYYGDSTGSYGDGPQSDVNCSGYCRDGPHRGRNVTTNQLLKFYVRDNDVQPPVASTNIWGADAETASGSKFTPSLVVATSAVTKAEATSWGSIPGKLAPISGSGRDTVYQLTDQAIGRRLTFLFNAYDEYLHSGLQLGNTKTATVSDRTLTNTAVMVRTWDAESGEWTASDENWADYKSDKSTIYDIDPATGTEAVGTEGTGPNTVLVWDFGTLTEGNVNNLFGVESVSDILSYIGTNSAGATNLVQLHLRDRDNNREGDQADAELTFGRLMLTDDDATAPTTPGVDFIGSGTNFVRFGKLVGWNWGNSGEASGWPCTGATNGMSGGALGGGVVAFAAGTRGDTAGTVEWKESTATLSQYMRGTGADWNEVLAKQGATDSGEMKYFEFDVTGVNETRWVADTLVFRNRRSSTGPTNFALTVMSPTDVDTYPALDMELGALSNGWEMVHGSYGKVAGLYRATFVDADNTTATLESPEVTVDSSMTYARVVFRLGGYGISEATHSAYTGVTMTWAITADGEATDLGGSIALSSFTNSAAAENYRNWNEYSIDLPVPASGDKDYQVTWTASGINGSVGFVMRDVSLMSQDGWGQEDVLVSVQTDPLDVDAEGKAIGTSDELTMMWTGEESGNNETLRFRLYAWGASGYQGVWGVNNIQLHGISFSPKGHEVTDHDLRNGWWTNALEVLDGTPTGYDTEQSGLWIKNDGSSAYAQKLPSYEMRWPAAASTGAGDVMASGLYGTAGMTEADYTTVPDGAFTNASSSWTATGGADARYAWGKAKVGATVLRLPGGSTPAATQTVTLNRAGLAHPVTGATVGGVLYIRALSTTDEDVDNRLSVTLEMLNSGGTTLASKTYDLTATLMARWQEVDLGSWAVDNPNIQKLKVTIAQTESGMTEVYVDDVEIQVALWGGEEDNPENGTRGGRFRFSTAALPKETVPALPLSDDLGGGETAEYTLSSLVYDYDHDRTDDALPLTAVNRFSLYDNDTMAPLTGNRFGGAMGIRLGNGSGQPHSGAGNSVIAYVTDHDLETTEAAAQAVSSSHGKLYLDIDGYDLSGWTTDDIRTDYTNAAGMANNNVQLYAVDQSKWFKSAGGNTNALPEIPSETNTLVSLTSDWWTHAATNEFATQDFNAKLPVTVRALLRDLDNDRTDDAMSTTNRIGLLQFIDNDANAPQFKTTGMQLKQVFIGTNADAIATVTQNVAKSTWDAKAQFELRTVTSSDTASARTQRVYDSELTAAEGSGFYVIAGLGETKVTTYGRSTMGVQRGTSETQGRTNAFGDVFTVTNTHLKLASDGAAALVFTNWSSAWSCPQADTVGTGTVAGHNTWYWGSNMDADEIAALLPSGETKRSWTMTVEAYDADTDRPDDQMHAQLAGPTLQVWDDDMQNPYDLEDMKVNGSTVSGSITRENAAWTNNLENWKLNFRALGDRDPTEGEDLRKSGVNLADGYRMVMKTETVTTTAGNAWLGLDGVVTLTAEDDPDTSGRVDATPSAEMLSRVTQGLTTQMVFAVDADADRTGDALASGGVDVPLAYDITPPMEIGYMNASSGTEERLTADPYSTDDPTTQFDLRWPTRQYYNGDLAKIGPDDPNDDRHPAKSKDNTDYLSPWKSYKIYYTNYDAAAVPASDASAAADKKYIYTEFVKSGKYTYWTSVMTNSPTEDPTAPKESGTGRSTAYDSLGTVSNTATDGGHQSIRLYDLDFDQDYAVVIVGVDKAGNEGPAGMYSWATNDTIKFAVTQGVIRASADINTAVGALVSGKATNTVGMAKISTGTDAPKKGAVLYWMAAGMKDGEGEVKKYYDLIYRDAASFNELGTEQWGMASTADNTGTSKTNWNYQADAGLGTPGRMRFYRASYAGRWQGSYPLASEEVYSMNNVVLSEGYNYVSLQGVPYTNTFAGVFGTDKEMWPSGDGLHTEATKIQFFSPGTTATVSEVFFFGSDGEWYNSSSNKVTTSNLVDGFFARPFGIVLPNAVTNEAGEVTSGWWKDHSDYDGARASASKSVKAMMWHPILQVPTNGIFTVTNKVVVTDGTEVTTNDVETAVYRQTITRGKGMYNTLSLNLPVEVHPKQLGLVVTNASGVPQAGGMSANDDPRYADKLYSIDPLTKDVRGNSMMYCDASGKWRWVKNGLEVTDAAIKPNDMLVLISVSNAPASWTWEYTPAQFYKLPDRHMGRKAPTSGD